MRAALSRTALSLVFLIATTIGLATFAAGTASAAVPQSCDATVDPVRSTISAVCVVRNEFRIRIYCKDGISGKVYTVYGNWAKSRHASKATCSAPQRQSLQTKFDVFER